MRIAQVAPLFESVPPRRYGGTERVVSYLTEGLVARGHAVTLFASADSVTSAELVAYPLTSLRNQKVSVDHGLHQQLLLERVFAMASAFDVIHFHIDYQQYPLACRQRTAFLTTCHGRMDLHDYPFLFRQFPHVPLVSISDAQRAPLRHLNWVATVHHGLPEDLYRPTFQAGGYLCLLGRVAPEKGVEDAIAIARRTGIPLRIAAKVGPPDAAYFQSLRKELTPPLVEFVGEVDDRQKNELLGGALALLMPVHWPEPFGLVMIEAMACGTPVIAYRAGSVPEVVEDGVTGFICNGLEEAVRAVSRLSTLSRVVVRERFRERFSVARMVDGYLSAYARVVEQPARARTGGDEAPSWTT
ncbi:MAG: glycosyltransferase family 4 protein [Myxococcota bacterium]